MKRFKIVCFEILHFCFCYSHVDSLAVDPTKDSQARGDPFKTLFVARLSYEVKESDLEREFGRFGPIERVYFSGYYSRTLKDADMLPDPYRQRHCQSQEQTQQRVCFHRI